MVGEKWSNELHMIAPYLSVAYQTTVGCVFSYHLTGKVDPNDPSAWFHELIARVASMLGIKLGWKVPN